MKPNEAQFQDVPRITGEGNESGEYKPRKYPNQMKDPSGGKTKFSPNVVLKNPMLTGAAGFNQAGFNKASDMLTEAASSGLRAKRDAAIVHNENVEDYKAGKRAKIVKLNP